MTFASHSASQVKILKRENSLEEIKLLTICYKSSRCVMKVDSNVIFIENVMNKFM